jgi:cytochrome b pre-mRNA-processing protein 3
MLAVPWENPARGQIIMLTWFKRSNADIRLAPELYGLIVTAARQPEFYLAGGVPDTKEGRFALLVVHLSLVLERLRPQGERGSALGQQLIETFVTDIDDNMREIGIGDLSVPRNVKKAAAALENRWNRYRDHLAADPIAEAALADCLAIDLFGVTAAPQRATEAAAFARYMVDVGRTLAAADAGNLLAGKLPALPPFKPVA